MSTVYMLRANHGDVLDSADFAALQTIRRTLLGLLDHGAVLELESFYGRDVTEWSYRPGSEDGAGILAGLLEAARVIAPPGWILEASGPGVGT